MDNHRKLIESANLNFKNADHMIYVTYPIVNDPKLVMTIVEKLYSSVMDTITALLTFDYLYKRISYVPEREEDKIRLFKEFTIGRYSLNRELLILIGELKDLLDFRKRAPVEFTRKENFVVCSARYSTKTINIRKIKSYVQDIKTFLEKANRILKDGL